MRKMRSLRIILSIILVIVLIAGNVTMAEEASVQASVQVSTQASVQASPLPVKVLLLPKFEVGEMTGDFPGEAQYYYEHYLMGAEEYDVPHCPGKLYYKDGIAMCVLGMGKINAALNTMAILSDRRFDYSEAYIISTGCAGSSTETTVMGDVFLITSAVDYDLGHHADARELSKAEGTTWFHDVDYDDVAVVLLNQDLMEKVYALVKDTPVETTEVTRNYMRAAFDGADWAVRDPLVLRGTTVTGDNYWKGQFGHLNALQMTEVYHCPDPYATTEMEDVAVARTVERMGMLDRLIILRDSVNMDVFMLGATPESLWGSADAIKLANEENVEAADIFMTAMRNNFKVGQIIIDRILDNQL